MKQDFSFVCAALLVHSWLTAGSRLSASSRVNADSKSEAATWNCEWDVHYDTWIPTFKPGEYEDAGPSGGAHCLHQCCQDPNCKGIQLESSEQYQCYEYASPPEERRLDEVTTGRRLGDGAWLVHQRPAWSVFMKASREKSDDSIKLLPPPPLRLHPNMHAAESDSKEAKAAKIEQALDKEMSAVLGPVKGLSKQHCQWAVYYDRWEPSFVPGEYRHNNMLGRAHCLEACCQDPSCAGIQLESSEMSQCYKYTSPPAGLLPSTGLEFGDGEWLRQKRPAWSVLVKASTLPSWRPLSSTDVPGFKPSVTRFDGLQSDHSAPLSSKHCDWDVHYDKWIPTMVPGEFEHNDEFGGAHCLEACCEDPTCVGLALESSEKFQCYKYAKPPVGLETSRGRRLGDGKWLRSKRQAWSIVMKVDPQAEQGTQRIRAKKPAPRVQSLRQLVRHPEEKTIELASALAEKSVELASSAMRIAHCSSSLFGVVFLLALLAGLSFE